MIQVLVLVVLSFASSVVGSLAAWVLLFHFDVEAHWEAWRMRRGKNMTRRQRRAAVEFLEDPEHKW